MFFCWSGGRGQGRCLPASVRGVWVSGLGRRVAIGGASTGRASDGAHGKLETGVGEGGPGKGSVRRTETGESGAPSLPLKIPLPFLPASDFPYAAQHISHHRSSGGIRMKPPRIRTFERVCVPRERATVPWTFTRRMGTFFSLRNSFSLTFVPPTFPHLSFLYVVSSPASAASPDFQASA